MIKALAGIAVVTCGASALNQAMERKADRLMHRTKTAPWRRAASASPTD